MVNPKNIFDAASAGDVNTVRTCLADGTHPATVDENGLNALHHAAIGTNTAKTADMLQVMQLLIEAGSPLEATTNDGRTALYLAAEFSPTIEPIQLLLDAGANADVYSAFGNHVVVNAMSPEVQKLLSQITGKPVPIPQPYRKSVKINATEWRKIKVRIDNVFDALSKSGLIAAQDVGQIQDDGYSDCLEIFHERGGVNAGLLGFCFYTREDLNRAKRTSQLAIAFWGAPEGNSEDMKRVGGMIVEAFQSNGFTVDWDGSESKRISVYLQDGL